MKYSQECKQAVLAKLAPPHQRTVEDVAAISRPHHGYIKVRP